MRTLCAILVATAIACSGCETSNSAPAQPAFVLQGTWTEVPTPAEWSADDEDTRALASRAFQDRGPDTLVFDRGSLIVRSGSGDLRKWRYSIDNPSVADDPPTVGLSLSPATGKLEADEVAVCRLRGDTLEFVIWRESEPQGDLTKTTFGEFVYGGAFRRRE